MIYEMVMGQDGIRDILAARKFPFPVMYGPEESEREIFDTAIIFRRDDSTSDAWGPARGIQQNPRRLASRFLAAECRIYAKSSLPNATIGDHEALTEQLVDGVTTAIEQWTSAAQAKVDGLQMGEMRYLRSDELPAHGHERDRRLAWAGRVYHIRFLIGRSVNVVTYLGEARPTGTITGVRNRTEARLEGASDSDPPTIGCNSID